MRKQKGFTPSDAPTQAGHPRLPQSLPTGFTLMELLVVIAIIAVLMSILMPVASSVKQQAKAVICQSNLHQWGFVMNLYTEDYDGFLMPDLGHEKYAALGRPELKEYYTDDELLLCPMATRTYQEGGRNPFAAWRGDEQNDPLGNLPCSYGINSWVLSKPCASGTDAIGGALLWKTPSVRGAVKVPMVIDCAGYENATPWHYDEPPEYNGHWVQGTSEHEMRYVCLDRHNKHMNGVFLDFSVRKVGLKQLWELRWHRNWYKGIGNVPDYNPPVWPDWMKHMKEYVF